MNNKIRVCLVGAGRAAQVHANSLANHVRGAELVALVDNVPEALNKTADKYGVGARFASLDEALEKSRFDAVVITVPTFAHAELAVRAAQAGKHIFLEKPMALSLAECDRIIAAVEANHLVLQLGFMRHFSPEFVTAEEHIKAGDIGQPMLVKSLTHGPGLPPPWARDLKTSNGNLAEVNSHDWDTIRWLTGSNYHRVYAETSNFKGPALGVDTEHFYDNALVNVRMENGSLCSISSVCPCNYGYDARVEIVGETGILQIGELQGQPVVFCNNRDQGLITPIFRTWPERFAWGYIHEMEHFVECVRTGTPPKVGGLEGRWAVAGVLAATKSFLEARPVYMSEILNEGK